MVNLKAAGHRRPPAVAVAPTGGAKKKNKHVFIPKITPPTWLEPIPVMAERMPCDSRRGMV
jgi:hypothetical protein